MSLIPIFDLDDTLYDELTYVHSGFRAVAAWGHQKFGWDPNDSYDCMASLLITKGRGKIFNEWLNGHGSANEAIKVYRHHTPTITLWDSASHVLRALAQQPLYMVTDGHKIVQAKKIETLGIASYFKHAYITHRYGIRYEKPSTYCFELIKKRESCAWKDMVYIGDNPHKDFVNLNMLGVHTIRVSTGQYASLNAKSGYDAKFTITDLDHLLTLLPQMQQGTL